MASIGIVDAQVPEQENPSKTDDKPNKFYFGVFFDGTGNNAIQKKDAIAFRNAQKSKNKNENWDLNINPDLNKFGAHDMLSQKSKDDDYSNVAFMHFHYQAMDKSQVEKANKSHNIHLFNIYVEGAGKEEINDDSTIQDTANAAGSGFGGGKTGVVALVSKAVMMVMNVLKGFGKFSSGGTILDLGNDEVHFDVFGFSRGAACARMFSFLVARSSVQTLTCEKAFGKYAAKSYYKNDFLHFMDSVKCKVCQVDFLGIYDTVSSIGILYTNNVKDYGLHSPTLTEKVKNTFHLCAMDEFRSHFALTDIGTAAMGENAEIFIPGCHSDVGGGYLGGTEKFSIAATDINVINAVTTMFVQNPQALSSAIKKPVREALNELGWIQENDTKNKTASYNYLTGKINITRMLEAGYNIIPLKMMITRANLKTKRNLVNIEGHPRFKLKKQLQALGETMIAKASRVSGRHWYYPDASYSSPRYRYLRQHFLHFSTTDAFIKNKVHGPSKTKDNSISRIIYKGDGSSNIPMLMCDYNANAESI